MPIVELEAVKDTYVDEGAPDSTFGTDTQMRVRSDASNNARSYLEFDMDQLPPDFDAFDDPLSVVVQVLSESDEARTIKLDEVTGDFGETTLTWNTQPAIGTQGIGNDASNPDLLTFDLLGVVQLVPTSGPFRVRLRDDSEGGGLLGPFEQTLATREHATEGPPVLRIGYVAARDQNLPSTLTVRRASRSELASDVLPRFSGNRDLAAGVDVVLVEDLIATVAPTLSPLEAQARVEGIVTRLFLEPLEDFRRISDEAGSVITRVQEGQTLKLRRIVQVVAAGTPAFSLSETPTFPGAETGTADTLRRGDAILFALGDERWAPGARVTWDDRAFVVAGVLGVERLEDEVLYQEVGLRRLSVTTRARAVGVVG